MIQSTAPQWPMAQWPTLCEDGVVCACVMMEWFAADVKVELLAILSRRFFFDSNFAFRSHAHPEIPFRRFDQQPLPPTPDNDYEVAPTELEFHHELWKFSSNHGFLFISPEFKMYRCTVHVISKNKSSSIACPLLCGRRCRSEAPKSSIHGKPTHSLTAHI